jgi:hypothetical protein
MGTFAKMKLRVHLGSNTHLPCQPEAAVRP